MSEFNEIALKLQDLRSKPRKSGNSRIVELSKRVGALTGDFKSSLCNITSNLAEISGNIKKLERKESLRPADDAFIELQCGSTTDLRNIAENLIETGELLKKYENGFKFDVGPEIDKFQREEDLRLVKLIENKSEGRVFSQNAELTLDVLRKIRNGDDEPNTEDFSSDSDSFKPQMYSSRLEK